MLLRSLVLAVVVALWPSVGWAETTCEYDAFTPRPVASLDDMAGVYRNDVIEGDIAACRVSIFSEQEASGYSPLRHVEGGGFVAEDNGLGSRLDGAEVIWVKPGVPGTIELATVDYSRPFTPRVIAEYTLTRVHP